MERLCKEDADFLLHLAFVIGVRRKSFASFVEKGDRYEFCKKMVRQLLANQHSTFSGNVRSKVKSPVPKP